MTSRNDETIRNNIRSGYAEIARTGAFIGEAAREVRDKLAGEDDSACVGGSCCGGLTMSVDELAEQIGYTPEELEALPDGANMGLSCGNPAAIGALKPGETVIDLGAGAGFDAFLAGPKVGQTGRVIGVDMTHEMIAKARANIAHYKKNYGLDNVEFRLGEIEHLPVADGTADVVISNCVINLSTDKLRVWREVFRVLKPGGRVAVSDIALLQELPPEAKATIESWVGCVAGAALVEDIRAMLESLGFEQIQLTPKPEYVRAMVQSNDPLYQKLLALLPEGLDAQDCITSLDITARKPACKLAASCCS